MELTKNYIKDYLYDLSWVFMILGTAIGAGVLFLPIKLGENGIVSIFIMWCLMILVNTRIHILLSLLCLDEKNIYNDNALFLRLFRYPISYILMFIYILSVFFTMVFLSLSFVNTTEFLLQNRFNIFMNRKFIVVSVILILVWLSILKLSFIKFINNTLVFILCSSLVLFSFYLVFFIIDMKDNVMLSITNLKDTSNTITESFPIAIQSCSYLPLIFVFIKDLKRRYVNYKLVEHKIKTITFISNIILVSIIMFFTLTSVLAINYDDLYNIKQANISIVSYLAEKHNNILISWIIPIITYSAIITSFFSYYIGSFQGILELLNLNYNNNVSKIITNLAFVCILITFAIYNPSILSFMGKISGPLIVFISMFLPLYILYTRKDFAKYRYFILDGLIAIVFGFIILSFV